MHSPNRTPFVPADEATAHGRGSRRVTSLVAILVLLAAGCGATPPSPSPLGPTPSTGPSATPVEVACPGATAAPSTLLDPADRVFYELFVRSFADSNGDGIGDLAGLTAHLDYLNDGRPGTGTDLGVGGLWLMPIFASGSYHGYDVIDYDSVDPRYGSLADFASFIAAAHARGLKVLLDLVINHTSADHPWFKDALAGGSHRDWYVWRDSDPGWPAVAGGSPWHQTPGGWYYGAFGARMPDLNLANPAVTAEIDRIAGEWLDRGADGFRLDAAKHLIEDGATTQVNTPETKAWLATFRDRVHAGHPGAIVLGEVWEPRIVTTGYLADRSLDMVFDFGFGPAALGAARLGDASTLTSNIADVAGRYPSGGAATFLTNHDQARTMTELHGDRVGAGLAAEALLTSPGVPFIYYGEEIGLRGAKPDEDIRTPLPWTGDGPGFGFTTGTPWEPLAPDPETVNVAAEAADPGSLLASYRTLIGVRQSEPVLAVGGAWPVAVARRDIAVTLRWNVDRGALVIQNLGDRSATALALDLADGPLCGRPAARVVYRSGTAADSIDAAGPKVTLSGGFSGYVPLPEVAPYTTVVIDLTP